MTSRVIVSALFILCPFASLITVAQESYAYPPHLAEAKQIGAGIERTIKINQPKWRKQKNVLEDAGSYPGQDGRKAAGSLLQSWKSGKQEVTVTVRVLDSNEEASRMLGQLSRGSSVSMGEKLEGFGDEASFMTHQYFSWVGVRRGRALIEVRGPGPDVTVSRRFAQHGLDQLADY